MKLCSAWDVVAVLCLLGFTSLTVTNHRSGNAAILREVLLVLGVVAMWLSLRLA